MNETHVDFLTVYLTAVHILKSLFGIFGFFILDVSKATAEMSVRTIDWHVDHFDGSITSEYFCDMIFTHITCETGYVDLS